MIRTPKDMKLDRPDCGYVAQKLGFDNRRPFNLGLNDQKTEDSPFKMTDGKYYYKIGDKTVTKAQYNAYENPVGDGPTKSTNDPDASGRIAKREVTRANNKASKRPTALTKKQTELKDQGTKAPKKRPPFKKHKDSPLHFNWKSALDKAQTGLTVAGMIPGVGNLADGLNTAMSGARAGYAKYKGDEAGYKTHRNNAAINAAAMVPGAGLAVGGAKLAAKAAKGAKAVKVAKTLKNATDTTKVANRVASNTGKIVVKKAVKKAAVTGAKKGQEKLVRSKANKPKKNVVYDSTKTVTAKTPKGNNNKKTTIKPSKNIA